MYKPPVSPSVAGCGPLSSTPTYSVFSTTPRSSLSSTPKSYGSSSSSSFSTPSSTSSYPTTSSTPTKSTPIPSSTSFTSEAPFSTSFGSASNSLRVRPRFSPYFSPTLHIQEEEVGGGGVVVSHEDNNTNSTNTFGSGGGSRLSQELYVANRAGGSRLSQELLVTSPLLKGEDGKSLNGEGVFILFVFFFVVYCHFIFFIIIVYFSLLESLVKEASSFEQIILWLNLVIMFVSYFAFSALAPFWPDVATVCCCCYLFISVLF